MSEVVVRVKNLKKTFKIPLDKSNGIKQRVINLIKGSKGYREFSPLSGVTFEIKEGDFFGIVGRNGSGKSTLLKSIAGIYTPTNGSVDVKGKLIPFIELGVGFSPELSGRDNVYLNGALLGFSRKEIDMMYDEIVDFAELHDFMDERLKNYSSGMQVRLAFSIAIKAQGDILLLDEILAVGDEAFQRKCYQYFAELKRNNKTVILVTHSMESVQQFCNKAIMIDGGKIVKSGNPSEVAQAYSEMFLTNVNPETGEKQIAQNDSFEVDVSAKCTSKKINIDVELLAKRKFKSPAIAIGLNKEDGELIWRWASDDILYDEVDKNSVIDLNLDKNIKSIVSVELDNFLPAGRYNISIYIRNSDRTEEYARWVDVSHVDIEKKTIYSKYWNLSHKITHEKK